jgi:hypothetical protein
LEGVNGTKGVGIKKETLIQPVGKTWTKVALGRQKNERKLSYKKADEREPPGFLPLYFSRGP